MVPRGLDLCYHVATRCVEWVPLTLLRWLECLHMYNIVIEDRCDLKKWLGGGGGGSLIGQDS